MQDRQPVYGNAFERSLRALGREGFFYPGTVVLAVLLFLAMAAWLGLSRISVYSVSRESRNEMKGGAQ